MSADAPDTQPSTDARDADDLATSDIDTALIPQEKDEDPKSVVENRAKANADPGSEPAATGAGDKNTDPNAQPPA